jgi:hypothetical protein
MRIRDDCGHVVDWTVTTRTLYCTSRLWLVIIKKFRVNRSNHQCASVWWYLIYVNWSGSQLRDIVEQWPKTVYRRQTWVVIRNKSITVPTQKALEPFRRGRGAMDVIFTHVVSEAFVPHATVPENRHWDQNSGVCFQAVSGSCGLDMVSK